jgi:pyruvate,water dikinase
MATLSQVRSSEYVRSLEQVGKDDVQACGGKGANLGELTRLGMRVPPGFCIVSDALPYVLETNRLTSRVAEIAAGLRFDDPHALEDGTARIREVIATARIPVDLETAICERYRDLVVTGGRYVAVRSSVAVKDSPVSSFPGLMDTFHYVLGQDETLEQIRQCWASLWTARAAFVRHERGIAHERGLIAPLVQVMIDADCAGVMFTANPVSGSRDEIVIEGNWGIGESVVSGAAVTDHYVLDKQTLVTKTTRIPTKTVMVTVDRKHGSGRAEQEVPAGLVEEPTLSGEQLFELGSAGKAIEGHFGYDADVEWAYRRGELFLLQTRRLRGVAEADGQ